MSSITRGIAIKKELAALRPEESDFSGFLNQLSNRAI